MLFRFKLTFSLLYFYFKFLHNIIITAMLLPEKLLWRPYESGVTKG